MSLLTTTIKPNTCYLTKVSKQRLAALARAVYLCGIVKNIPSSSVDNASWEYSSVPSLDPYPDSNFPVSAQAYSHLSLELKKLGRYSFRVWVDGNFNPVTITLTKEIPNSSKLYAGNGPFSLELTFDKDQLEQICRLLLETPCDHNEVSLTFKLSEKIIGLYKLYNLGETEFITQTLKNPSFTALHFLCDHYEIQLVYPYSLEQLTTQVTDSFTQDKKLNFCI